jgi:hypothetical protein
VSTSLQDSPNSFYIYEAILPCLDAEKSSDLGLTFLLLDSQGLSYDRSTSPTVKIRIKWYTDTWKVSYFTYSGEIYIKSPTFSHSYAVMRSISYMYLQMYIT